jgi:hypothetical protein
MSTGTDISALYREFTDALTEVLAEMRLGSHAVAALRGRALRLRSTLTIASMHISWRWRLHSKTGKPRKTSVTRTGPCKRRVAARWNRCKVRHPR